MYKGFAQHYDAIFTFDEALYLPILNPKGKRSLDIGCGTGRLVDLMARHGYEAIGIDLDSTMVEVAKRNFPTRSFRVQNMLDLQGLSRYDLMTCFGNTLAHLNATELKLFVDLVSLHLVEGGEIWIQLLNYDRILDQRIESLPKIERGSVHFIREYVFQGDYLIFNTTLISGHEKVIGSTKLHPYRMEELRILLGHPKLSLAIYGSTDEREYDPQRDMHIYLKLIKKDAN